MGTGGGEQLMSFEHPPLQTAVTEGWLSNYQLLQEQLAPKGVNVQFVADDDHLNFPDHYFDIVINRHESFDIKEVRRVMKNQGFFITQQVGCRNGQKLANKIYDEYQMPFPDLFLENVRQQMEAQQFEILFAGEAFLSQKFFSMEALIYYIKTIPWEYPDFSVAAYSKQLLSLHEELTENGWIENQAHRFILVAQLKEQ